MAGAFLLVIPLIQPKYHEIQICRKNTPHQIRDLQIGGNRLNTEELPDHPDNQEDQYKQPHKSGKKQVEPEEDNAPEEIEKQLKRISIQCAFFIWVI